MTKERTLLKLILLSLITAPFAFFSTNLIEADLSYLIYGDNGLRFMAGIPAFLLSVELTFYLFRILRLFQMPHRVWQTTRFYAVLHLLLGLAGLWSTVMTAVFTYGDLFAPYPFPGYLISLLILHLAVVIYSIILLVRSKGHQDDIGMSKGKLLLRILRGFVLAFGVYFALNRLGAVLVSYSYVHVRTLSMTFPLYLYLLQPIILCLHIVVGALGYSRGREKTRAILALILFFSNLLFGGISLYLTFKNPLFTSAVSPAMGLERLMNLPIETVLQYVLISVTMIVLVIRNFKKARMAEEK